MGTIEPMPEPSTDITIYSAQKWEQLGALLVEHVDADIDGDTAPTGARPWSFTMEGLFDDEVGAWMDDAGALVEAVTGWDDDEWNHDVDVHYLAPGHGTVTVHVRESAVVVPLAAITDALDTGSIDGARAAIDAATASHARRLIEASGHRPYPFH